MISNAFWVALLVCSLLFGKEGEEVKEGGREEGKRQWWLCYPDEETHLGSVDSN